MKFAIRILVTMAVMFVFTLAGLAMVGALTAFCEPAKRPDPQWLQDYYDYHDPGPGIPIKQV